MSRRASGEEGARLGAQDSVSGRKVASQYEPEEKLRTLDRDTLL